MFKDLEDGFVKEKYFLRYVIKWVRVIAFFIFSEFKIGRVCLL